MISPRPGKGNWLARLGMGAFAFFLVKGLLWLAIPLLVWRGCHE